MLFLNASEIEKVLPMVEVIPAMKDAYAALSSGKAQIPIRTQLSLKESDAVTLFMPAYLHHGQQQVLSLKAVSVFPHNTDLDLPIIHAAVLVLDPQNGKLQAVLEGSRLTALRTGGASGAATDVLARADCQVGAIFGAGVQGRTQLQAICTVRSLERVWVFDPDRSRANELVEELAGQGPIPDDLRVADSPSQAVQNADLICTATTSQQPVFEVVDLKPGTHINGVGSFKPDMIEISPDVIKKASVFVGSREGVLAEAGEILAAVQLGLIDRSDLVELGDVILQNTTGRVASDQITFFKSVGVAVQDAAAAHLALKNARRMGLGREINW